MLDRLISGRLLARNAILNLLGLGLPLVVAVLTVPLIIGGFGTDRFGILTLAWVVLSYFSLFDLGLGRALTKIVAEKLAGGQEQELPSLIWTGLSFLAGIGLAGTLVLGLISPWLVREILKIPDALETETLYSFYLLALSIPIVIGTGALRGVLEGRQRFDLINAVRIFLSTFNFVGPLLVLPFSDSLFLVIAVLVAARAFGLIIHFVLCLYAMPLLRHGGIVLQLATVRPLLGFGSWVTVADSLGTLLAYVDRFLIGALMSTSAVAFYSTPQEMVTKLWVVPQALVGVLFSAFSASFVQDRSRTTLLFGRGVKYTFLFLFPITLLIVSLGHEGLTLWLGDQFAKKSTLVLQLLAVGVMINSLAFMPFAAVQAAGRADLTAKLHAVELPLYLLVAWWLINSYGIGGAAVAWVVRVVVDALILFVLVQRYLPARAFIRRMGSTLLISLVPLTIAMRLGSVVAEGILLAVVIPVYVLATWFFILDPEERALGRKLVKKSTKLLFRS